MVFESWHKGALSLTGGHIMDQERMGPLVLSAVPLSVGELSTRLTRCHLG